MIRTKKRTVSGFIISITSRLSRSRNADTEVLLRGSVVGFQDAFSGNLLRGSPLVSSSAPKFTTALSLRLSTLYCSAAILAQVL